MKKIVVIALLGVSMYGADSSNSSQAAMREQMFIQMKTKMLPGFKQMIPLYSKMQSCFEKTYSKKNYVACTKTYAAKMDAIAATMMPAGQKAKSALPSDEAFKNLKWSKKLHQKTITQVGLMSKLTHSMVDCLEKSKDAVSFGSCTQLAKQNLR